MNPVHLALGAAIVVLAIVGLCWVLARVADGLERAWDWLSWRFRGDDQDDYTDDEDGYAEPLEELPPERSREELGFTGPQPVSAGYCGCCGKRQARYGEITCEDCAGWEERALDHKHFAPHRERRAPWWEVQQRAAYESLGLDYPSGLLARVREAGQ